MPIAELHGVSLAYDVFGPDDGEPVVLLCGLGQPAVAWQLGMVPVLSEAGYRVVTFDNRGMAPSSAPPAPYSIDAMADDTVGLLDHMGVASARLVGYSMGGWIAETIAYRRPERVHSAVLVGSCNVGTSWEKLITTVERDMARLDPDLPKWFQAAETIRYLSNAELQQDDVVDAWLAMIGDLDPWPNPGRLGQYEAALAWSLDADRAERWPTLTTPVLVLSFENDVDSPPAHARQAAGRIPGAQFVEVAGASHLGVFTHAAEVAAIVLDFLGRT